MPTFAPLYRESTINFIQSDSKKNKTSENIVDNRRMLLESFSHTCIQSKGNFIYF